MEYVFYFDESFHDRKIVIKENGRINTLNKNTIDSYIGVFWGCKQKDLRKNIEEIELFEAKQKKLFGLPDIKELKSQCIASKNYEYGLQSFNSNTISFYEDLFLLLERMRPIIQINMISKIEWMLRMVFHGVVFPDYVKQNCFYYSLTKFFVTYWPREVIESMAKVSDYTSACEFQNKLVDTIEKLTISEEGIARKEHERDAFLDMAFILEGLKFNENINAKTDFCYYPNFEGLCRLLKEKNIDIKKVKITIDEEENTFQAAQKYNFGKVSQAKSENVVQIRLADFISGFVGRMIHSIMCELNETEEKINDVNCIDKANLVKKRILPEKWFELSNRQFDLYQLMYKVLIVEHSDEHWACMTESYADGAIAFYSLFRYLGQFQTYEGFLSVTPKLHSEYYNSHCCMDLERHYKML